MPLLQPFRLNFRSGLHAGTRGADLEHTTVHLTADTLFSALVDAWRRTGGDPPAFAAPFAADPPDPPFRLTSAFPFAGDLLFFPAPANTRRLRAGAMDESQGKALKRTRYLSTRLFRAAIGAQDAPQANPLKLQEGALLLDAAEAAALPPSLRFVDAKPGSALQRLRPFTALAHMAVWAETRVPRVTVDRLSSASTIFHIKRTSFAAGCGLWFGVEWRQPDATVAGAGLSYRQAFDLALAMLEDDGLGGERAAGYGAFTLAPALPDLALPDAQPGEAGWLLSRCILRSDEVPAALQGKGVVYQLAATAGWTRSAQGTAHRRRRVFMLEEGSCLQAHGEILGQVVDVGPVGAEGPLLPHPVYRYGLGLMAGIRQEEQHG